MGKHSYVASTSAHKNTDMEDKHMITEQWLQPGVHISRLRLACTSFLGVRVHVLGEWTESIKTCLLLLDIHIPYIKHVRKKDRHMWKSQTHGWKGPYQSVHCVHNNKNLSAFISIVFGLPPSGLKHQPGVTGCLSSERRWTMLCFSIKVVRKWISIPSNIKVRKLQICLKLKLKSAQTCDQQLLPFVDSCVTFITADCWTFYGLYCFM